MIRRILVASAIAGLVVAGSATVAFADTPNEGDPVEQFFHNLLTGNDGYNGLCGVLGSSDRGSGLLGGALCGPRDLSNVDDGANLAAYNRYGH
ncbi:hypothetical protein AB0395_02670 [Streptosporangium sp. NPDC051023]|uniref:hypothetical protein n=1 Tax=Streptosporangium sp. NPDC051023 TaxID=3155410 RepID=UPI00344F1038